MGSKILYRIFEVHVGPLIYIISHNYVSLTREVTITRIKMYRLASDIKAFVDLTCMVTCVVTDTCVNRLHLLVKMYCKVHRVYQKNIPK